MVYHLPRNHPEFPKEKGKGIPEESKLLLNTVRGVTLDILDGKKVKKVQSNRKGKSNLLKIVLPQVTEASDLGDIKVKSKDAIHKVLSLSGIHTHKKIKGAIFLLGKQYENMSKERFHHRLENGKVLRDIRFLFGILQIFAYIGNSGIQMILSGMTREQNHFTLRDNSPAIGSLYFIVRAAKRSFQETKKSKGGEHVYKQFLELLKTESVKIFKRK